ncbi:hypothetical protein HBI70_056440 [Parastagonospora nodorum]|nr:hypothetical protein HBI09_051740 [Parastagonospora nodorum]KAH4415416.1 hypothetical protein HBH92_077430 [Parastagonospora nodorum]KAH4440843.1 hypothetical protein HBH93_083880 [Parastagonospora nodorum]KAH4451716.1 hypothetical protein HBH91_112110 [Parastagonospora nodorum]KAH4508463.1 hypothetical protein HBH89_062520 [Parastagonospora nodorum]
MESIESLRAILANSARTPSSTSTSLKRSRLEPLPYSGSEEMLHYPAIDVPGSDNFFRASSTNTRALSRHPGADMHTVVSLRKHDAPTSPPGFTTTTTTTTTSVCSHTARVRHPTLSPPTLRAENTGSTLSLASTADTNKNGRDMSSIWDSEDDEWMDAGNVAATFKASYNIPAPRGWGDTIKNVLVAKKTDTEECEKVQELGNTWGYDANGDANDEVIKTVHLPPTRDFAGQSPRCMRVVDLEAYFTATDLLVRHARPRLCDAVATEFVYRRKVDNNEGGLILVIRREGNEVICGAYHNLAFKKLWKLYVKSVVSVTGQWHEVFATVKTGEMAVTKGVPEWSTILPEVQKDMLGLTRTKSAQRKLQLSPTKKIAKAAEDVMETDPKFMLFQSRVVALRLLWDIWYLFDKKYDCRATWATDGKESEVRLSRALVGSGDLEDYISCAKRIWSRCSYFKAECKR